MIQFTSDSVELKFISKTNVSSLYSKEFIDIFNELKSNNSYILNYKFELIVKYTNSNLLKTIWIIKKSIKYFGFIKLHIGANYSDNLIKEIIKLDCVEELILEKRYKSNISFESMKNIKYVKYNNHYYSNLKLLPSNLEILKIKFNFNKFIELPKGLNKLVYHNDSIPIIIEMQQHKFNNIFIINTQKVISLDDLEITECLIINKHNKNIDFLNLPTNIKCIYFCQNPKKIMYSLDYLPDSINELNFLSGFDINIFNNIPISIKIINIFINEINQSQYFPILTTTNVEYINIFISYNSLLKINSDNFIKTQYIPKTIKEIKIINNKLPIISNSDVLFYYANLIENYKNIIENYKNSNLMNFNFIVINQDFKNDI